MKKRIIVALEEILRTASTEGLNFSDTKAIVRQYTILKPKTDALRENMKEAVERLKDDGIREIEEALLKHNAAVESGTNEDILSQGLIDVYNKQYTEYLKKVVDYEKELLDEEEDLVVKPISPSGLEKFLSKNNLPVDKAAILLDLYGDEND